MSFYEIVEEVPKLHQEFTKFLRRLDSEYEPDLELHLIMARMSRE